MPDYKDFPTGAQTDPKDEKDILFRTIAPSATAPVLPRRFSLRDEQSPVALQKYGSCVGFAGKSAMEYFICKATGVMKKLSGRFLYGRSKEYDGISGEGTFPRVMLKVMFALGAPLDDRWPQEPSPTHTDYIATPPDDVREEAVENVLNGGFARVLNYDELKRAIFEHGPVLVTLNVYDTYDTVGVDGMVQAKTTYLYNRGAHENIAVGWDDDKGVIEVKNNWDKNWGNDGYGFIPLTYEPNGMFPMWDMWLITDLISAAATAGAPIKIGYPVDTDKPVVTQAFGARPEYYKKYGMKGHNGIDFRTRDLQNRFIVACDDGEVILAGQDGSYGLAVRIKHSWGTSIYAHNSQLLVGDSSGVGGLPTPVKRGQRIAIPGATGDTGFPPAEHCHFGIRINGVKNPGFFDWVDPSPYFGEQNMTKYFKVLQDTKAGIMILEGFSGTLLFENDLAEYQQLLKITAGTENAPVIQIPAGKFFRINDHGKQGVLIVEGFTGTVLFENDWTEYQTLLKICGLTLTSPVVNTP